MVQQDLPLCYSAIVLMVGGQYLREQRRQHAESKRAATMCGPRGISLQAYRGV